MSKTQIVSYKLGKLQFEIICKQDMAIKFKENQQMSIDNVIATDQIFTDAQKGDVASQSDIKQLGDDPIRQILLKGHVQLSTEERRRRVEQKLQEITGYIHNNFLDMNSAPVPFERVSNAIAQIKGLQIDPFANTQTLANEIIKKLEKADILHLQNGEVQLKVICGADIENKVYPITSRFGAQVLDTDYGNKVTFTISISAGQMNSFIDKLKSEFKGNVTIEAPNSNKPQDPQVEKQNAQNNKKKGKKK